WRRSPRRPGRRFESRASLAPLFSPALFDALFNAPARLPLREVIINALHRAALLESLRSGARGDVASQLRELDEISFAWRSLAPGEPNLALGLWCAKTQQPDVAARMNLARNCHLRQERDAVSICDHLHDGSETRGAEAVASLRRQHVTIRECLVAQAMALLQQQEPVMCEHVGARPTQSLVPPRRFGSEDEPVVEQMKRLDLGVLDGQGD